MPVSSEPQTSDHHPSTGSRGTYAADALVVFSVALAALLLGCYELFDPDVWWHLRTGQWIIEHHRVPQFDLFTFTSADRPWIDLHWGFQVVLALADSLGHVPGMILLAAVASAAAVMIALTARTGDPPAWFAALCWLPALALMATRFDPRPEVFSCLFLAGYLAVLNRADRVPRLAWVLPGIQVLWVNTHSLFILGPIVLACCWLERASRYLLGPAGGSRIAGPGLSHRAGHFLAASAAVLLGTLVNPYGARAWILPLELWPKIGDPSNPYKSYIDEFTGLHTSIHDQAAGVPGMFFHLRLQLFLLVFMIWSFVPLAVARTWSASTEESRLARGPRVSTLAIGSLLPAGLALAYVLGLPLPATPAWVRGLGRAVPVVMAMGGVAFSLIIAWRSRAAAATLAVGSLGAAAWAAWLRSHLFDSDPGTTWERAFASSWAAAGLVILAAWLVLRAGGSLFRMLVAAAFTFLSFQAVRNVSLFALTAGAVIAWNLGEWMSERARTSAAPGWRGRALIPQVAVIGLLTAWCLTIVTDRYYAIIGDSIHFGLRERPGTFAHEAARFAGQPGMPDRALAFHLGQAGVYVYHNGPGRRVYMDGRLEVPSVSTFRDYLRIEDWLNRADDRWDAALIRLGDPAILIGHQGWFEAEAALLAHPRWRCVYFDAVAAVFLPRGGPSSSPEVPEFDFAASRPDGAPAVASVQSDRRATEVEVLLRLASLLRRRDADPWRLRIPMLIGAWVRAREWLAVDRGSPGPWRTLGLIAWEMVPDLKSPPPGPSDGWDPASGLCWSRATAGFRHALEAKPGDIPTLKALAACFGVRRMGTARSEVDAILSRRGRDPGLFQRLEAGLAQPAGSSWEESQRTAITYMHLGNPVAARAAWAGATDAPSRAVRWARMAAAELAAGNLASAETLGRHAVDDDRELGEAWYLLTITALEAGRASDALSACQNGLRRVLTSAQRANLEGIERLLRRRGIAAAG